MPSRRRSALSRAAGVTVIALLAPAAMAQYQAPNAAFSPPANYYNLVTGSAATLKHELYSTISVGWDDGTQAHVSNPVTNPSNWEPRNYGDLRYAARVLFKDTNWVPTAQDPYDHILWVYDRTSFDYQWDGGSNWNREHSWPQSKVGVQATNSATNRASDIFEVFPANSHTNSSRGNAAYGLWGQTGPAGLFNSYFYPGDADRGDVARTLFYMATRYSEGQGSLGPLTLGDGQGGTDAMGDLTSLLHWNYEDGVDNFERRKSWLAMTQDTSTAAWDTGNNPNDPARDPLYKKAYYQGNRNPFIDHPEYVWAAFGGVANSSKIYLDTSNPVDGASTMTVTRGRIMKNGTFASTSAIITKTGTTPTTYDITQSGAATTTAAGTGQPFNYNGVTRTISVDLTGTATTGIKSGVVTINNTDLTTAGTGTGSADGNDTINVSGTVVDNRVISASAVNFGRVIAGANVTYQTDLTTTGDDDHFTHPTVKGTAVAADANGVQVNTGVDTVFNSASSTTGRTVQGGFSTPGVYSSSRPLVVQGEGLAGEAPGAVNVAYSATVLAHAQPSFNAGTTVTAQAIDFGYVPAGFSPRDVSFAVVNNPSTSGAALTAGLDVDGDTASGSSQMSSNVVASDLAHPLAAGGTPWSYHIEYTPTTAGSVSSTHTIATSDENVPGGGARANLVVTATGYTLASASFPTTSFMSIYNSEPPYNTGAFSIAAGATLTFNGDGTMNITGAQSNGAGSALIATAGTVNFNTDAGSPSAAPLAVTAGGSSHVSFNATQHLASLTVNGSNAFVSPGANKVIVTSALSAPGRLDLSDNKLIVRNTPAGSLAGSTYTGVSGMIQSSRNGGGWGGTGITTSQSDATTSNFTTLAVASAADLGISTTAVWAGETVSASDLLVMYTYDGDANLDGKLNIDDYTHIDQGILAGSHGFSNGDFNYDGKVNIDDYTIIDSNVGAQGAPFGTAGGVAQSVTAVPEPACLALIASAGFLLRRSRRRSSASAMAG